MTQQKTWPQEFLVLLTIGTFGWTVEAWLCRYFWNHDVGIGGSWMLLFGPPLVMIGSLVLYNAALGLVWSSRRYQNGAEPLTGRRAFRAVGLLALVASCIIALWGWGQWHASVAQSFGRYVPRSEMPVPLALDAIVCLPTLLSLAIVFIGLRTMIRRVSRWG